MLENGTLAAAADVLVVPAALLVLLVALLLELLLPHAASAMAMAHPATNVNGQRFPVMLHLQGHAPGSERMTGALSTRERAGRDF
ncbi:MAG: hypothetical protein JO181_19870 [Solirubrobacterales bacterium]|nr:hypothetical protein [Solirubrobacterales bacterium]